MATPPAGYTDNYHLAKWDLGANPGAEALNHNWDIIDSAIKNAAGGMEFQFPLSFNSGSVSLLFNSTNLKLTSNQLNTIQDIATSSNVEFGALLTKGQYGNKIKASGNLAGIGLYDSNDVLKSQLLYNQTADSILFTHLSGNIFGITSGKDFEHYTPTIHYSGNASYYLSPGGFSRHLAMDYYNLVFVGGLGYIGTHNDYPLYFVHNGASRLIVGENLTSNVNHKFSGWALLDNAKGWSTNSFISGYFGAGGRFDSAKSFLELDNLVVRNTLRAHIFQKDIVRASNGFFFISDASEIVAESEASALNYFYVKEQVFQYGDLLWYKDIDDNSNIKSIKIIVANNGELVTLPNSTKQGYRYMAGEIELGEGEFFKVGGTIVRTGGGPGRQGSIYFDASSAYAPFMDIYDEVSSWAAFQTAGKLKVRLGKLSGITSSLFGALGGYGLYSKRIYLESDNATNGIGLIADNAGARLTMYQSGNTVFDFNTSTATAKICSFNFNKDLLWGNNVEIGIINNTVEASKVKIGSYTNAYEKISKKIELVSDSTSKLIRLATDWVDDAYQRTYMFIRNANLYLAFGDMRILSAADTSFGIWARNAAGTENYFKLTDNEKYIGGWNFTATTLEAKSPNSLIKGGTIEGAFLKGGTIEGSLFRTNTESGLPCITLDRDNHQILFTSATDETYQGIYSQVRDRITTHDPQTTFVGRAIFFQRELFNISTETWENESPMLALCETSSKNIASTFWKVGRFMVSAGSGNYGTQVNIFTSPSPNRAAGIELFPGDGSNRQIKLETVNLYEHSRIYVGGAASYYCEIKANNTQSYFYISAFGKTAMLYTDSSSGYLKINNEQVITQKQAGVTAALTSKTAGDYYQANEKSMLQEAHNGIRTLLVALRNHGLIS